MNAKHYNPHTFAPFAPFAPFAVPIIPTFPHKHLLTKLNNHATTATLCNHMNNLRAKKKVPQIQKAHRFPKTNLRSP